MNYPLFFNIEIDGFSSHTSGELSRASLPPCVPRDFRKTGNKIPCTNIPVVSKTERTEIQASYWLKLFHSARRCAVLVEIQCYVYRAGDIDNYSM